MRVFITGEPGVGKTTLIKRIYELLKDKYKVGGFITEEIREKGRRVGFKIKDFSGNEEILAYVGEGHPRVGKYRVYVKNLDKVLESLSWEDKDIILIDEIGAMEFKSKKFKEFLDKVLSSNKDLIATLHRHYVNKFKDFGRVIRLEKNNREEIFKHIVKVLENEGYVL
ncbi:NTPase [Methanocaldococcus infernus]|uniref:Nucleoside-triphosphatase Metin_0608 n=1 Tax=Methanocaldococcus infernus (strain DSM 11812 / JCM 15783 / ME) TaxID=573063 RepID=D5VRS4_METIM|nr:NTPase [Methanocaldococcus infernus]ADG13277.1 protein of unknown function DUF265 [Methanocaldococcus infernus ME]